MQTLNGLAHVDYKNPARFLYAELFGIARQLNCLLAPNNYFNA